MLTSCLNNPTIQNVINRIKNRCLAIVRKEGIIHFNKVGGEYSSPDSSFFAQKQFVIRFGRINGQKTCRALNYKRGSETNVMFDNTLKIARD